MAIKITQLPAAVAALLTQLIEVVTDPSGSPVSQRITVQQLKDVITPFKVYRALITQSSTNDPVVVVLENTLGAPVVWAYDSVGTYFGTLAGAFPVDKVFSILSQRCSNSIAEVGRNGDDSLYIQTSAVDFGQTPPVPGFIDGLLDHASIEIRVYP